MRLIHLSGKHGATQKIPINFEPKLLKKVIGIVCNGPSLKYKLFPVNNKLAQLGQYSQTFHQILPRPVGSLRIRRRTTTLSVSNLQRTFHSLLTPKQSKSTYITTGDLPINIIYLL